MQCQNIFWSKTAITFLEVFQILKGIIRICETCFWWPLEFAMNSKIRYQLCKCFAKYFVLMLFNFLHKAFNIQQSVPHSNQLHHPFLWTGNEPYYAWYFIKKVWIKALIYQALTSPRKLNVGFFWDFLIINILHLLLFIQSS